MNRRGFPLVVGALLMTWAFAPGQDMSDGSASSDGKEGRSTNKIVALSAVVNCSSKQAFELFTKEKDLEDWLTTKAHVEPKVGGAYELFWDAEDRENNSTIGCKVTGLEIGKYLSFEWKSPKQFKHFANSVDPLTHVVVFFIPQSENSTEIHLVHSGWRSTPDWEKARLWQDAAWKGAFEQLSKVVGNK